MNYYYSPNGGDAHGPVTAAQLTQMYSSGTLTDTAQVCQEGTETWQPISVLGVAPLKRAAISMGATALIVEVFGLLIWVGYVSQVRGPNINIVLYGIGAVSLFGGGILGLVAAIKGDGRIPGIIACVLLVLGFIVFG